MKRWALITGACVNTGAAIVEKFASEGENTVFTGRNEERVREAEARYRAKYPEAKIIGKTLNALDKNGNADETAVKDLFAELEKRGIFISDLILNAADLGVGFDALESPLADFQRVMNTNVSWNFCLIQSAAVRMAQRRTTGADAGACARFGKKRHKGERRVTRYDSYGQNR